jgi:hypothetical protein
VHLKKIIKKHNCINEISPWQAAEYKSVRILLPFIASSCGELNPGEINVKRSPRKKEVCGLVRNGMVDKEIARMPNLAFTPWKIRPYDKKKLGIANKGINLYTYLNSL